MDTKHKNSLRERFAWYWGRAARWSLTAAAGSLLIAVDGRPLVRLVSRGPLIADIIRGDANSNLGWISPSFGVRVPTNQIVFKGTLDRPSTIVVKLLVPPEVDAVSFHSAIVNEFHEVIAEMPIGWSA